MAKRPIRDLQESIVDKIPSGPRGFIGGGSLVGMGGFSAVELVNNVSPLPVGYNIRSSSVVSDEGGLAVHEYEIWAASRDVAQFVAKRDAAGPNLNFALDNVEVVRKDKKIERAGHTLWLIRVEVERKTSPGSPDEENVIT